MSKASEELRKLEDRVVSLETVVRQMGSQLRYFRSLELTNTDSLLEPTDLVWGKHGIVRVRRSS